MADGMTPADMSAVLGRADGGFDGFGGEGLWIFALLILLFGGGGFGFGARNAEGAPVTEAGLCNAMNFNNLENAVGRLNDSLQNDYMGLQNGICNLGYETLRNFNTTQQQLAQCCCETQRAVDGVNYNGAINTAEINANTTAQTQKVLDAIQQNKIDALQAKVTELQTAQMFCGIPRINPYGYGVTPQFANACGAYNSII